MVNGACCGRCRLGGCGCVVRACERPGPGTRRVRRAGATDPVDCSSRPLKSKPFARTVAGLPRTGPGLVWGVAPGQLCHLLTVGAEELAQFGRVELGFLERREVAAARGLGHPGDVRRALEPRPRRA